MINLLLLHFPFTFDFILQISMVSSRASRASLWPFCALISSLSYPHGFVSKPLILSAQLSQFFKPRQTLQIYYFVNTPEKHNYFFLHCVAFYLYFMRFFYIFISFSIHIARRLGFVLFFCCRRSWEDVSCFCTFIFCEWKKSWRQIFDLIKLSESFKHFRSEYKKLAKIFKRWKSQKWNTSFREKILIVNNLFREKKILKKI